MYNNKKNFYPGTLCRMLLHKPWERIKFSQRLIHFFIIIGIINIYFEENPEEFYLLIPTTTKNNAWNETWLKINGKDWYREQDVFLKLDELFVVSWQELLHWKILGINEHPLQQPPIIVSDTLGEWKLENKIIWNKILNKLQDNLKNHKTMFFILNRDEFEEQGKYFNKKNNCKFIFKTNAFIPKWDDNEIFLKNINKNVNEIRCNGIFMNNYSDIENYKNFHFNPKVDSKKIKLFESYFRNKIIKNN